MDTTPQQAAEGMVLVQVLAAVLDRLVCANSPLAREDPGQITKFHALKSPGIGVKQYLERIHKYASCSNECFILALVYIDRLIQKNNFLLTELNVHRVVITAVLLAAKFFDDAYYNNAYYAKVGGVLVSEMNGLEVDFLFRINFSLHVTPELFHKYHGELVAHSVSAGLTVQQRQEEVNLRQAQELTSCQTTSPHLNATPTVVVVSASHAPTMVPQTIDPQKHRLHHTDHGQNPYRTSNHHHPMHITPSPPPPTSQPIGPSPHVAPGCNGGEVIITAQPPLATPGSEAQNCLAFTSTSDASLSNSLTQQFTMLQRHNSLPPSAPPAAYPIQQPLQQKCSPHLQPFSAPAAIVAPVSAELHQTMPVASSVKPTEQYIVVDHAAYQVHGGLVHHNHQSVGGGVYNQHGGHVPVETNAPPSHGQMNTHHFVGGQMIAGISGSGI